MSASASSETKKPDFETEFENELDIVTEALDVFLPFPCTADISVKGFEMLFEKRWEGDFLPFGSLSIGEFLMDLVHEKGVTIGRCHFGVEMRHFNGLHNMWETALENTELNLELRHQGKSFVAQVGNQGGMAVNISHGLLCACTDGWVPPAILERQGMHSDIGEVKLVNVLPFELEYQVWERNR